jgi:hypothetical protein
MKLVNENGTLVGKDPESGETIPVEFDAVSVGSIDADSVSTDALSAGFMPEISTVYLNGRDPQLVVDAVDPYTRIVADPTNQHTISSPLTVTTEGLRLEGFNLFVEAGAECDCIEFRSDHGRVRNCRLNGNRENQSSGVAGLEDANGVTVTNCTDVIVEGCHVVQTRAQGILVSSYHSGRDGGGPVSHVRVRDNTIEGVWNGGILVQGGGEDPCEFVWIENNEVRNFQNEGIQAIDGCQNVWLTDNEVMGDTPGMVVENHFNRGVDRPIRNVTFSGNTIDVDSDGFIVEHPAESLENVTITGNTINASGDGISVGDADWGDLSVTDNTIIGDGDGNGIYINPNSLDGIEIRGNLIKQFERGVFKDGAPLVQGDVTDNRFYGCTDGIIWQNSPGANITGNFCRVSNRGIIIESAHGGNVSGVKVTGNHIEQEDGVTANGIETLQENGLLNSYLIKHNSINVSGTAVNDTVSGANSEVGSNQVY